MVRDFLAPKATLINGRTSALQSLKEKCSNYLLARSHIARILGKEATDNKKVIGVK